METNEAFQLTKGKKQNCPVMYMFHNLWEIKYSVTREVRKVDSTKTFT